MSDRPRGQQLLELPQFNKGTAFSQEERLRYGLMGLLPPRRETLQQQVNRAYRAYHQKDTDIGRHIFLRQLQDYNETLFYRLISDHVEEMTPIIYTPTVGEACQRFSEIYRKPRGLFISYPEREYIDDILANATPDQVDVIVMTDAEAILGIGDQGAGGMGIPIGKLSLYTANGGIDPKVCLPIMLDVGTNNKKLLDDPFYIGWAHERITGKDYYDFFDGVMQGIKRRFPKALVQFEDFGRTHANILLERYRDQLCCFNDDIQGTAAVAMGTVLAGVRAAGGKFVNQKFCIVGAGNAGTGIANQLVRGLVSEGLSEEEAKSRFYLVDRDGLLRDGLDALTEQQVQFARTTDELEGWQLSRQNQFGLYDVVRNARPHVLIGVSGQTGMFNEKVVRTMAELNNRPIILPLSNPTIRAEAFPDDVIRWSDGRALVATGSPFEPILYNGIKHEIAQCNNSYAFPGIGLGVLAVKAQRISDEMFMSVAEVIGKSSPKAGQNGVALLPPVRQISALSKKIAIAVGKTAIKQGLSEFDKKTDVKKLVEDMIWLPDYQNLEI